MNITELVNSIPIESGSLLGVKRSQVQEIIRLVLQELASADPVALERLLKRYKI